MHHYELEDSQFVELRNGDQRWRIGINRAGLGLTELRAPEHPDADLALPSRI